MKRIYFLTAICLLSIGAMAQNALPQWAMDLVAKNPEVIDSIHWIAPNQEGLETQTYMVYYHQPLKHSNPTSAQFPLRSLITVYNDADVSSAVNHVFFGGYGLSKDWLTRPDSLFAFDDVFCRKEIAKRYHATFISPEYRYYQFSAPNRCYENLDDLRSEEAAEDFHSLITALKKVMNGKWVISGGSKGGIATLMQHAFHPEDADIFVPYSAPFFNTDRDTEMQKYWYQNGWNEEYREMFMNVRRQATVRMDQIYPIFHKMLKTGNYADDIIYGSYLANTLYFGFYEHAYEDINSIEKKVYDNSAILQKFNIPNYNDTVYAYMLMVNKFSLDNFEKWIKWLRGQGPLSAKAPTLHLQKYVRRPFGITEEQWWDDVKKHDYEHAYEYQAQTELGYFNLRFDQIVGEESAAEWNATYDKYVGTLLLFNYPYFASLNFNPALYDHAMSTTQNATKPIVFLYGEDDTWTGAAIKDQYVNGTNVQKFILPSQNHLVSFSSNSDKAKCDAIREILDGVLGNPQGIETVQNTEMQRKKILRNGQIYILHGGKMYNTMGVRVN